MRRAAAKMATLVLLAALAGCGSEAPPGPTTADLQAERQALAGRLKRQALSGQQAEAPAAAADPTENSFSGVGQRYAYDPAGKRDPFRSFRWDRDDGRKDELAGPLEQFELEQLAVTAVVWDTGRPRALVSDPSGRSYIIHEGTRVGKNDGRVIHIGDNLVLVKETYVNFEGEQTTKDVELRIRRSQGG